jgi:hypothetical protein
MTTAIIDPRSIRTSLRSNPFPTITRESSGITIHGVRFVVVEMTCMGCTEPHQQSPCLSRSICDVCTRSVVQPYSKRRIVFTTRAGEKRIKQRTMMEEFRLCARLVRSRLAQIAILPHLDYSTTCFCRRPKIHGSSMVPRDR